MGYSRGGVGGGVQLVVDQLVKPAPSPGCSGEGKVRLLKPKN
jgi:hypothetical protein